MPSALPINNGRKPNYLITPSHCVQTELPVVDNKYLISEKTGRINQGCRVELLKSCRGVWPQWWQFTSCVPYRFISGLTAHWPQLNERQATCLFLSRISIVYSYPKQNKNKPWFSVLLLCLFNKFLEKFPYQPFKICHCIWNILLPQHPESLKENVLLMRWELQIQASFSMDLLGSHGKLLHLSVPQFPKIKTETFGGDDCSFSL